MASNNPQHPQAQVQPVRLSQPQPECQHHVARHVAPSEQCRQCIPPYLPPAQHLPNLSSMSSDNEVLEYAPASNHVRGHEAQRYYGVQGVNLPAPSSWFQYQQLGYTIPGFPYQPQPDYNNIGIHPRPVFQTYWVDSLPGTLDPLPGPHWQAQRPIQNRCAVATAPTIRHAQTTVERPPARHSRNRAVSRVELQPSDDEIGPEVHSTPALQWISSGRFYDNDRRIYLKGRVAQLKQEPALDISQSVALADRVFPMDHLPFPVDDSLLEHLARHKIWDIEGAHFLRKPESFTEDGLADWLNIMGKTIGLAYNKKLLRIWSASAWNLLPSDSKTVQKLDLVLLDREEYIRSKPSREVRSSFIRAFAEVSTQESFPQRMLDTINEKSYLLFLTQGN